MDRLSPTRASATVRLARSCFGAAGALLLGLGVAGRSKSFFKIMKSKAPRTTNSVTVMGPINARLLAAGLAAGRGQGQRDAGGLQPALALQGRQLVVRAVAQGGELLFQIVVFARGSQLIESLSGGLFLGYGFFEAVEGGEGVVGAAHPGQRFGDFALRLCGVLAGDQGGGRDRKSTRLNSSHLVI